MTKSLFVSKAFALSFALKAKNHDLFVNYSSHVETFHLQFHLNGWRSGIGPDYSISIELKEIENIVFSDIEAGILQWLLLD